MREIHFVDTHAHIASKEFQEDLNDVILRAKENHVDRIMIITLAFDELQRAIEIKRKDPKMFQIAFGIFPTDTKGIDEEYWQLFVQEVKRDEVDCIGEIGLDYYWEEDKKNREIQKEFFIKQIELAREVNKPFLVHSRDAIQDTYDVMKKHHHHGLMHCYSGTKEMAKEFTKLGYYIALGGAITFKNARHSIEVCESIDDKYLLSETDSPYMAPTPNRGKRNEPSYIPYIVEKMAEVKGQSVEEVANVIDNNWTRFLEELK